MIDSGIVQAGLSKPGIVGVGLVSPYSRYFRTNDELSHISIPEITFNGFFRIEFDLALSPAGTGLQKVMDGGTDGGSDRLDLNWGEPDGNFNARAYGTWYVDGVQTTAFPRDGVLRHVVFERTAVNTDQTPKKVDRFLARLGNTLNLSGELANVLMYDNGTLVRNYPINEGPGTNDVADLVSGQNGSIVNGNDSDKELFNQQADGDYLGQNLLPQINFLAGQGWIASSLAVRGTETEFSVTGAGGLAYDNLLQVGSEYRLSIAANNTPDTFQAWNALLSASNLIGDITSSVSTYDFTALDDAIYLRTTEAASYQNIELDIKRLLRVA